MCRIPILMELKMYVHSFTERPTSPGAKIEESSHDKNVQGPGGCTNV